jgi:Protein of unknown function (DUF1553)/Protein of unknown function (DUF1549)/Concanavalin A-like lectin/glucanases superfamily/Planctomycete cytochrome C
MTRIQADMMRRGLLLVSLILAATVFGAADTKPPPPEFNRDIRPIFVENCYACHGPDSAARKADLRLDVREEAIKAEVFVPGQPDKSTLIDRINSGEMPPKKTGKKLTDEQKDMLKRWIAAGAEYQPHWSFIAPKRPPVNREAQRSAWARTPIDDFILEKLNAAKLQPAPEADRRTLARRLSLDLIGLPPEPDDVEKFVNDLSPDWYEKYVDQLMASPHWGEHRGRYWLDAARYADTHGIHFDNYREIWAYRDWVIKAFNANMPFDRFTLEQLAGDLLPQPTLEQKIATGFNRCNITSNEGGAIDEEYLVLYTRDRTETASQVFLGLTAGCAVCHDHKLDPLSQREFYSLSAFFNNTPQRAMDGNVPNTPPVLPVPRVEDRPRWDAVNKEMSEVTAKLQERRQAARPDFDRWLTSSQSDLIAALVPTYRMTLHMPLTEGKDKTTRAVIDGSSTSLPIGKGYAWTPEKENRPSLIIRAGDTITLPEVGDFEKDQPFSVGLWIRKTGDSPNGAIVARMDDKHGYRGWDVWLQEGKIAVHHIHHWQDDAIKATARMPLPNNMWTHVTTVYDGSMKAAGLHIFYDGESQQIDVEADGLKNTTRTTVPLKIGQREAISRVQNVALTDLRIYERALDNSEVRHVARSARAGELLAKPDRDRKPAEKDELFAWWLKEYDSRYLDATRRLEDLRREQAAIKVRGTVAHVMQEKPNPPMAFVLNRGEYDQRRDEVKPDTPKVLPAFPTELPKNRVGLAKWLLRPEHPLTARVTVNRFWQELFGTGIVKTSGDFGTAGELPSHPELLDWLAVEFRENGWDVKKLFRLMVTSAAYRQAAITTPEKREKDPFNRLLSRGPRFRMDAEMVRDCALASSGLMVRKIGGPSVKPYQPEGVWEAVAMIGSDTRDYKQDHADKLYRRSMYTFWKRAAPPASLDILNAPNRETCAVRRERTNTPLQALVTLNDPQYIEAARHLAQVALQKDVTDAATIDFIARRVLARPLRSEELQIVNKSLADLLEHYRGHADEATKLLAVGESPRDKKIDPATHAAWTMLCNQLMNLDEALNK